MSKLFSDDEGSAGGHEIQLTINEHYSKAFEYRKEREELERLKAKYGPDYNQNTSDSELSTDSESAESEDEDGEELTPTMDAAILRTLARIKKKDPAIYDSTKNVFGEEQEKVVSKYVSTGGQSKSKNKPKPITVRQANLESMLHGSRSPSPDTEVARPLTHAEEQENLRKETINAFHAAVPEGDDFLVPREKTKDELETEEAEYRAFLEREVGDIRELVSMNRYPEVSKLGAISEVGGEDVGAEEFGRKAKTKKKKKVGVSGMKTKADEDQEFLMNYILNRGWIDRSERHVPTFQEITSTSHRRKNNFQTEQDAFDADDTIPHQSHDNAGDELDAGLSDSSFDSLASHFEASFNHRFEEPGAATIPTFPRNIQSTVRRQDTTRKEARERKKGRKEEEVAKKKEEIKRLKALKMREVRRKLEMIGRQAGLKKMGKGKDTVTACEEDNNFVDYALQELDLEGDWDPEKHDRQMADLFDRDVEALEDDEGGGHDEGLRFDEDGKPIWDDGIDIGDIAIPDDDALPKESRKKERKKKKKKKDQGNDEGVDIDAMDADVELKFEDDEEWDGTEEMRKRVLKRYMDELDTLDFNDMVGDLPTRFRYLPVKPINYSLTPAEILAATDQELNEYMSIKKYAPYRLDKANKDRFSKKNQEKLRELRGKVIERVGVMNVTVDQVNGGLRPKKRKGKKERNKMKDTHPIVDVDAELEKSGNFAGVADSMLEEGAQSKKRKRESHIVNEIETDGAKKKRKRNRKKEEKTLES